MVKVTVINLPLTAQHISRHINDKPMALTGKGLQVLQMNKP
jgi:hypothetical protein